MMHVVIDVYLYCVLVSFNMVCNQLYVWVVEMAKMLM
jgi:hypothetical protein